MIYVGGGTAEETKQNTEQYLNGFKDGNVRILIRIGDLSDSIDLNEDDISMSGGITVTSVLNPDTDMTFGTVSATELVMHIIKSNKTSAIDWSQPIWLYASTTYNNQQLMYQAFGQFYGSEIKQVVENGLDVYVYTGYEITASYNVDASDFISTLTFPMTGQELADALCAYCGYSFAIGTRAGTMMTSYVISQNPFPSSCTLKDIFRWIAEANGAYIHMGGYAQISTVVFNKPFYGIEYTLTKDDYFAPLNKAQYNVSPVPAVCYVDSTDPNKNEQYPSTYNGIPYTISDNPILRSFTNAEISTILSDIKSKMNYGGNVYVPVLTPIKVTAVGNPFVQVGDIINIVDQEDNTIPFYIYSRTFRWNGAATDEYECTGNIERQAMTDEQKTIQQTNLTISNRIVDSLSFGTKGMALDASQGKVLNDKIEWKKVTFTAWYPSTTTTNFQEFSMPELANATEIVGFVGASGSTQMTAIHLMTFGQARSIYTKELDLKILATSNDTYNYSVALKYDKTTYKLGYRQTYKGSNASYMGLLEVWYK